MSVSLRSNLARLYDDEPVRVERDGNPLYPLPADYNKMDGQEQRRWRVNAIRMQETPEDLVTAWLAFRTLYLIPLQEGTFYKRYCPSPKFHHQIVDDVGRYMANVFSAPRGTAKSTVLAIELPLVVLLGRRDFSLLLVLSKDIMVRKVVNTRLMIQLERNPLILEDFGALLPRRGQGTRSTHTTLLWNGSQLEATSVRGHSLGLRPDLIVIDDAEFDPAQRRITLELTEALEKMLVHTFLPMLDEGDSALAMIGTRGHVKSLISHIVTTTDDERFTAFNRRNYDIEDDGTGKLLWPEKFPAERLERDRRLLGAEAYMTQRRNRPGTSENVLLKLDDRLSFYRVEGVEEPCKSAMPLGIVAEMVSWTAASPFGKQEEVRRDYATAVRGMFRVLLMDYARCHTQASDYIAMVVLGVESSAVYRNVWWVLDLWLGREREPKWMDRFWNIATKWRVTYAGVEAVGPQFALAASVRDHLADSAYLEWTPTIVPVRYPHGLSKEDRISGLSTRLPSHLKLRGDLAHEWPWNELLLEMALFTGRPNALQHDDPLDAISMAPFLVGSRGASNTGREAEDGGPKTWLDLLEAGVEDVGGAGVHPGLGVNLHELPLPRLNRIIAKRREIMDTDGGAETESIWNYGNRVSVGP